MKKKNIAFIVAAFLAGVLITAVTLLLLRTGPVRKTLPTEPAATEEAAQDKEVDLAKTFSVRISVQINRLISDFSPAPRKVDTPPSSTPSISSSCRMPMISIDIWHATTFTP